MNTNGASAIRPALADPPWPLQLLKDAVSLPDATDDELMFFGHVAARMGLDPLKREIYMVRRWNPELGRYQITHQVGIDGFRTTAERTGKYQGQTPPAWCGPDGVWLDAWLKEEPPVAARVGVYRSDFREAIVAIARFSEYCQRTKEGKPNRMWRTMPSNQIAKCAEALALRKAFPNELGGMYTTDEMAQADNEKKDPATVPPVLITGNISENVQNSETVFPADAVLDVAKIVSVLQPYKETLGSRYYYSILRDIGGVEHSNEFRRQDQKSKAAACWKLFQGCQLVIDFEERLGLDTVHEILERNGYHRPQEIPTLIEMSNVLRQLKEAEVTQ